MAKRCGMQGQQLWGCRIDRICYKQGVAALGRRGDWKMIRCTCSDRQLEQVGCECPAEVNVGSTELIRRQDAGQAEQRGWDDRMAGKRMAESWTMPVEEQNRYINGYRDACSALAAHGV